MPTILEIFRLLIARRFQNALHKHLLVLIAPRLVLELGGANLFIHPPKKIIYRLKESLPRHDTNAIGD